MNKHYLKLVVTVLITVTMLFILCSCSGSREKFSGETVRSEVDYSLCVASPEVKKKNKIASSGVMELYYDKSTSCVTLRDSNTDCLWRSLPATYTKKSADSPSVVSLEVFYKGKMYVLNSQQDSVKNGAYTAEKTDSGLTVMYTVTKIAEDGNTLEFIIPVVYSLVDGSLKVSIDCSSPEGENNPSDALLTRINLLNYFGSSRLSSKNDYILVPDNCGGIIYPSKDTGELGDMFCKVYGDTQENSCILGTFGMKKSSNAFVAVIENGDCIASVKAATKKSPSMYNMVGAYFDIREYKTTQNKDKARIYISDTPYRGEISIRYRFLSGKNASYSGMAVACRELFIRNGVLSAGSVNSNGILPFILSAIGSGETSDGVFSTLTSYEQLQDMLIYLKAKGFNNIYVKYRGTFTGGLNQAEFVRANVQSSLGKAEEFKELREYMTAQKFSLFVETAYASSSSGSMKNSHIASDISGSSVNSEKLSPFGLSEKRSYMKPDAIEENIISLLRFLKDNDIDGISVSDASSLLYSDSSSSSTREDIRNEISRENVSVPAFGKLMVSTGNFYSLKNACVISGLKTNTKHAESDCYRCIPFVPLILHGTLDYSCEPLNYAEDYTSAVLRSVEFGCIPEFEWCYEEVGDKAQRDGINRYSYSQWATNAYSVYDKVNRALGDLRDKRMTSHYEVQNGVYCSEYGDSSVYVNYTKKDIEIGGVTIPANDFMRIG